MLSLFCNSLLPRCLLQGGAHATYLELGDVPAICLARRLKRNRSRQSRGGPHTGNTDHRKPAVLDFGRTSSRQRFLALSLRNAKGVEKSGHHVLSRDTALHVVCAASRVKELVMELDKSRKKKHLGLSPSRDGIPSLKSLRRKGGEVEAVGELSRKTHSGSDSPPAAERSHGDASVLNLCRREGKTR